MIDFIKKHKKASAITAIILSVFLFAIYIYAIFQLGIWYRDIFLFKQKDGSFKGDNSYVDIELFLEKDDRNPEVTFVINGQAFHYQIVHDGIQDVMIYKDDTLVFEGEAHKVADDLYFLESPDEMSEGNIQIIVDNGEAPSAEDYFPGNSMIYNLAMKEKLDTRGDYVMLIYIVFVACVLFVDILAPDFFFHLRYRLVVDGGEPSDFYRIGQIVSRIVLVIFIFVLVIATFTMH